MHEIINYFKNIQRVGQKKNPFFGTKDRIFAYFSYLLSPTLTIYNEEIRIKFRLSINGLVEFTYRSKLQYQSDDFSTAKRLNSKKSSKKAMYKQLKSCYLEEVLNYLIVKYNICSQ